jgi:carboxymethylenebutenolidase
MEKPKLNQDIFNLYDEYAHSVIDRRQFLERLQTYAIGGLTVTSILNQIMPDYQHKIQVSEQDPELITEMITYDSPKGGGKIQAQLSKPKGATGKLPAIIVVHENRGLNPHIKDVGRRAALAGYISISPDGLSSQGGYPGNDDDGRTMHGKIDRNVMLEDFIAAYDYLQKMPDCNGKIGVVGFCFGGWICNMMAAKIPTLSASVPYYGSQATAEDVPNIKAPLLLHYASMDERVNAGWPAYEAALKLHNKKYIAHMYEGKQHGFHNDTTARYDEGAAKLSWQRTLDFFKENLK